MPGTSDSRKNKYNRFSQGYKTPRYKSYWLVLVDLAEVLMCKNQLLQLRCAN